MALDIKLLPFVLLIIVSAVQVDAQRLCEAQGTCRNCGNGRFSYYKCTSSIECFSGEGCIAGFCCPGSKF
uniref:Uncharacterized protein n=1 Tax=Plectus sambesii TaxID=2011161 RepID=A0A914XLZ0_9BILA